MSNKKTSSIDWLIDKISEKQSNGLYVIDSLEDVKNVFQQAKAMHKEELKDAQMSMFIHLNNLHYGLAFLMKRDSAEDFTEAYYNETYGENNS